MTKGLATLGEALAWLEAHWPEQPAVPLRLHDHAVQPDDLLGAPKLSGAFWHHLTLAGTAIQAISITQECHHPRLGTSKIRDCPDCWGDGVTTTTRERFVYPMREALILLERERRAYAVVLTLARQNWALGELAPQLVLTSIRKLWLRYSQAPIGRTPKWTEMSEAQQKAMDAA